LFIPSASEESPAPILLTLYGSRVIPSASEESPCSITSIDSLTLCNSER
jgi:hypothetical protein